MLTPVMGPQGAAISTGVSYIVFFGLRTWLSNRVFPVDYQLPRFALALAEVFAFAVYGSNHAFAWHQLLMYLGVVGVILLAYRKDLGAVIATVRARLTGKKNRQ